MCSDRRYHDNEHERKYNPENFSRRHDDLHVLIRLERSAPQRTTRSQSFTQDKGNEKLVGQGQQILHRFEVPREHGRT
eukprot:4028732-Pyramimonas_sp.AAC.1